MITATLKDKPSRERHRKRDAGPSPDTPGHVGAARGLDTERWPQLLDLFDRAVDLTAPERERLLDRECGNDRKLRSEVSRLLAEHDRWEPLLEGGPIDAPESGALESPRRIGTYRILREVGAGGMGTVYLAEREEPYRQEVALKVLRREAYGVDVHLRFEAERQILARLKHPGISAVLDGGLTPGGRPYFVMEYVDGGQPITEFCNQRKMSIEARLELFRSVCDAVRHAHGKLIVHRDLKPSNLLVSSAGEVKLVDFGIAKVVDPTADAGTFPETRDGLRPMTPEYAAPEQILGGPLTTAVDVYSLGVVLYELLTGSRPHDRESRGTTPLAHAICESDPEPPSLRAVSTGEATRRSTGRVAKISAIRSLSRDQRSDLDNITLRALQRDPLERYRSVEALAEDIGRYLDRRPVLARPQTRGYRIRKFARRNRAAVAATSLAAAALVGGLLSTLWQADNARDERDRARKEAERAEQVSDLLIGVFDLSDPVQNVEAGDMKVREFVDLVEDRVLTGLDRMQSAEPSMLTAIGRLQMNLGRFQRAEELLEQGLAMQVNRFGGTSEEVAESVHWLATLHLERETLELAETEARRALHIREELSAPLVDRADSWDLLGRVLTERGHLNEAEESLREALAIRERELGESHPRTARTVGLLGAVAYYRGEYELAYENGKHAVEMMQSAYGDVHSELADQLNDLAVFAHARGDYDASLAAHERALFIFRELLGDHHPRVALSLTQVGSLQDLLGQTESAVASFEGALEIRMAAYGEEHGLVAYNLSVLGGVLATRGESARAEAMLRRALSLCERLFPEAHIRRARASGALARALLLAGRSQEAIPYAEAALSAMESIFDEANLQVGWAQTLLGRALAASDRSAEATKELKGALELYDGLFPQGHAFSAPARITLGDLALASGDLDRADTLYVEALRVRERAFGQAHWLVAESQTRIAALKLERGEVRDARRILETFLPILEQSAPQHPGTERARAAHALLTGPEIE